MAPDPDMIDTYWPKKPTALPEWLASQMKQLLMDETHPEWLILGQMVLITKGARIEMEDTSDSGWKWTN